METEERHQYETGSRPKIVVAESGATTRHFVEVFLQLLGYDDVVSFANGAEALQHLVQESEPVLVLLGGLMSGLDGADICAQLRSQADAVDAYLIVMSCSDDHRQISNSLARGADDYIIRPFGPAELSASLAVGRKKLAS